MQTLSSMDMEFKIFQMAISIKVIMSRVNLKGKDSIIGQMGLPMLESLSMGLDKGREFGLDKMEINIMEYLAMIVKMVQDNIIGKMEIFIEEISLKI